MSPFPLTLSPAARGWLVAVAFASASTLVHFAVTRETPLLEKLALAALAFVPLSVGVVELRPLSWLALAAAWTLSWMLVEWGGGAPLLYLPSVAIPGMLAWVFGSTLLPGRQPLVVSIALAARPQTPGYLVAYSRGLTILWTAIFAAMASWDALLAAYAPHAWWSFTANVGNYLLVGALVAGEYAYRRLRFPDYAHPGFAEYVLLVARTNPRKVAPR